MKKPALSHPRRAPRFILKPLAAVLLGVLSTQAQAADEFIGLGTLGGTASFAYAVSADGTVMVGQGSLAGDASYHAFRWSGGVMTDLGTFGGNSFANAVSADGAVVVGQGYLAGNASQHAFRWTQAGGMADLGTLGGTASYVIPNAVSADGAVVVGQSALAGNASHHAFRWTQAGGMADLGTLGGSLGGTSS